MTAASRARVSASLTGLCSLSIRALSATERASTRTSVAARSSVSTPSRRPAAGSPDLSRRGFSRTLSSASAQRVVYPLDLAAQRPGPVQPLRRAPRIRRNGQALGHLPEQVGHLAAQLADRLLGRLHPYRGEHQAGG